MKSLHTYAKLEFPCTAEVIEEVVNDCMRKYGIGTREILALVKEDTYTQGHPMKLYFQFWMDDSKYHEITYPKESQK